MRTPYAWVMGSSALILVPAAAVVVFLGTMIAMSVRAALRAVRAPELAGTDVRCAKCGYTIAPRTGGMGQCPECGQILTIETITTPRGRLATYPSATGAVVTCAWVVAILVELLWPLGWDRHLAYAVAALAVACAVFFLWVVRARRRAEREWVVPREVQAMIVEAIRAEAEGRGSPGGRD